MNRRHPIYYIAEEMWNTENHQTSEGAPLPWEHAKHKDRERVLASARAAVRGMFAYFKVAPALPKIEDWSASVMSPRDWLNVWREAAEKDFANEPETGVGVPAGQFEGESSQP